jgi:hypothetical protein
MINLISPFVFVLRHMENLHMKQNLVHTLYQVCKYGQMPVDKFHGIITPTEMDRALKYKTINWYSLPSDVLTSLIYKVSGLLYFILCIIIYYLILECYGFASYGNVVSNHAIMLDFPCLSTKLQLLESLIVH